MIPRVQRATGTVVLPLFLVLVLFAGISCGHQGNANNGENPSAEASVEVDDKENDDGEDGNKGKVLGVPVEVTRAKIGDISSFLLLSSTIGTESQVEVYSQTTGLVAQIKVEEGDHVRRGAVLARLDDEEYALDEAKAEVTFQKLQNDLRRIEQMHRDNLISSEEYENAGYELRQAELEWQKAKLLLEYTRIEAPIAGVVSERRIHVGDRITTNTHVFSVVNLDSMIAVVHVPEREVKQVELHQPVQISSDFIEGKHLEGWVKRISPIVDPNSGTFKVTVGVYAEQDVLRPGMFVNVQIVTGTHPEAILVPRDAIVYDGGREYIFLASNDSTAKRIELHKGFSNNQIVEVLSGIERDDFVIVVGQNGIKDGAKIEILEERAAADEGEAS
jgi:membrane fusion protein (multidrug efflux system)